MTQRKTISTRKMGGKDSRRKLSTATNIKKPQKNERIKMLSPESASLISQSFSAAGTIFSAILEFRTSHPTNAVPAKFPSQITIKDHR